MSFGGGSGGETTTYRPGKGHAQVVVTPAFNMKWGRSGLVEPAWPETLGATFTDANGITWRAILARKTVGTVNGVYNRATLSADGLNAYPENYFKYGVLTWLTGENQGVSVELRGHSTGARASLVLLEAMPNVIQPGDTFEIVAGCPKTRVACKIFDNINNHRGFPDMPTEDKALATPDFTQQGTAKKEDSGGS